MTVYQIGRSIDYRAADAAFLFKSQIEFMGAGRKADTLLIAVGAIIKCPHAAARIPNLAGD